MWCDYYILVFLSLQWLRSRLYLGVAIDLRIACMRRLLSDSVNIWCSRWVLSLHWYEYASIVVLLHDAVVDNLHRCDLTFISVYCCVVTVMWCILSFEIYMWTTTVIFALLCLAIIHQRILPMHIHRVKWRHICVVAMRSPFCRSTHRTVCS